MTLYMLILEIGIVGVLCGLCSRMSCFSERLLGDGKAETACIVSLPGLLYYGDSIQYLDELFLLYSGFLLFGLCVVVLGRCEGPWQHIPFWVNDQRRWRFQKVEVKGSLSDYGRKCSDGQDDSGIGYESAYRQ